MDWRSCLAALLFGILVVPALGAAEEGIAPAGENGRPLNLDFETGDLRDWTATGDAFNAQPIKGDTVNARRSDMHARHSGNWWIGTFEIAGDAPRGTLASKPFNVTHPWARFLVGGGSTDVGVEIVLAEGDKVFFRVAGENREDMSPVAVDLRPIMGKMVYLRIVDDHSLGWGHVNFDDFRFFDVEPKVPKRIVLTEDVVKFAGLTPEQSVKAMTLPEGFSAKLFAGEPDVHQPIAMAIDDRGRLWVAEAYTYPVRAPEGQGRDDILIFEDTDGDGHFDKRTVFATGLNLVSGLEVGFGGVFVGAAPYLLFIPDRDGDDKPDSAPQVLLDGWAYQDTHETLNAFAWGPDGWLYGCHGVFTHSRVGKPGTPDEQRVPLNAAVWRYHPQKQTFEVFAEGTSNPWGIDWNDQGQAFITACVIPHLYYIIQGGRYQRQAGSHFNPYVYDDIKTIADHVHWLGDAGPHAGNNKSSAAGGGHAHCGAMVYLGDSWPAKYRNSIFMANIHGNRFNNDRLESAGSGYVGHHAPDPILMNDKWSRPISFKYGPDGSVFFIDWYDKQACHNPQGEIWDRTNGRIFKVIYKDQPAVQVDLSKKTNAELVRLQLHPNDWYVRHARRLLQERQAGAEVKDQLVAMLNEQTDAPKKLRALWALYGSGGLSQDVLLAQLHADDPNVRAWAVQLSDAFFDAQPMNLTGPFSAPAAPASPAEENAIRAELARLAEKDPSPIVRLAIASALQRMHGSDRLPILQALLRHAEDADDHNLPLMYWYAAEPVVGADYAQGIELARQSRIPLLREFIARRICAIATSGAGGDAAKVNIEPLNALATLLAETNDAALSLNVLSGMADGLKGWPSLPAPRGWSAVYEKLSQGDDAGIVSRARELSVAFGEERALASLRAIAVDATADMPERRRAIEALVAAKDPRLPPVLQSMLSDAALRSSAVRGLAGFEDPATPKAILDAYSSFDAPTKVEALNTLASRSEYAAALRSAVDSGRIPRTDVTAATLRQLASLDDPAIQAWLKDQFGTVRSTPKEKLAEIERWTARLSRKSQADAADPQRGRAVFAKTCQQCHTLYDVGGKIGPDLTGSNRADIGYLLSNMIDPSAVIGKDYQVSVIKTKDRRVLSGIVKKDDGNVLTLQTETEILSIPKAQVTLQKQQSISMMPEGLLVSLKPEEVRDLVAYLGSQRQVPMSATPQNAAAFFNGKDLAGWSGDPMLWHVESGEIVGKTDGLKKNVFLFSTMSAADFRLTLKVKLVNNAGNSGIQFRSVALEDSEARGYQADIGAGWWGKLYEENGRQLLWKQSGEPFVKPGEWNTYEVLAVGSKIRTAINGHPCVDLDDPRGARRGIFGLQLHAGGPTEVRFKDLKLEIDPEPTLTTVASQ